MERAVRWMEEIGADEGPEVGEDVRLLCELQRSEFSVPPGFVVLPEAYEAFVVDSGLLRKGRSELGLNPGALTPEALENRLRGLREVFLEAAISGQLETDLREAFQRMERKGAGGRLSVSVRPFLLPEVPGIPLGSLVREALYDIRDPGALVQAVRNAWRWVWRADLFARYAAWGMDPLAVRVILLVQQSVWARVSGVFHPGRGPGVLRGERVVDACWGMGEALLTDGFEVDRFILQEAPLVLVAQNVGSKEKQLLAEPGARSGLTVVPVPEEMAEMPCLGWEQIQEVAATARAVGRLAGQPRQMHWAYENGELFILRVPAVAGEGRTLEAAESTEGRDPRAGQNQDESGPVAAEIARSGAAGPREGIMASERNPGGHDAEAAGTPPSPGRLTGGSLDVEASAEQEPIETAGADETMGRERARPWMFPQDGSPGFAVGRGPGWRLSLPGRARAQVLASLFRSVRKGRRLGGPVQRAAEFSHRHTSSRYWNESYYFNFTDPGNEIGGFSRIGMVPNQDMAVGILYLFLPEGGILMVTQTEPCRASRDTVSAGLLRYERVEPLWAWRIRFQGTMLYLADPAKLPSLLRASAEEMDAAGLSFREVSLDILFRGWSACHDFKGADPLFIAERFVAAGSRLQDLRAVSKVASEHYEQVGGWRGEIVVDGRRMEVHGSGHRDHSWGDRDWKAPSKWTWLTAQFGEAFGFNLSRVVIRSLDLFNGYVCRAGKNYPLRRAWLDTEFEEDGLTQKRILLRVQDTDGWEAEVEGRPRIVVPLTLQDGDHLTLVNEALTAYRWKGRTGYGISEYLHQLGSRTFPPPGR